MEYIGLETQISQIMQQYTYANPEFNKGSDSVFKFDLIEKEVAKEVLFNLNFLDYEGELLEEVTYAYSYNKCSIQLQRFIQY
jgi:hypothetical protein